jgi:hypothetical protein
MNLENHTNYYSARGNKTTKAFEILFLHKYSKEITFFTGEQEVICKSFWLSMIMWNL